jgi:hypothetical protein
MGSSPESSAALTPFRPLLQKRNLLSRFFLEQGLGSLGMPIRGVLNLSKARWCSLFRQILKHPDARLAEHQNTRWPRKRL